MYRVISDAIQDLPTEAGQRAEAGPEGNIRKPSHDRALQWRRRAFERSGIEPSIVPVGDDQAPFVFMPDGTRDDGRNIGSWECSAGQAHDHRGHQCGRAVWAEAVRGQGHPGPEVQSVADRDL